MSTEATIKMLAPYREHAGTTGFLSSLFLIRPGNIYAQKDFEIDVERDTEMIAASVPAVGVAGNANEASVYVNKKFTGTPFKETASLSAEDLNKRLIGSTPFDDPDAKAIIANYVLTAVMKIGAKIRRAAELQASEVLTTGIITNRDAGWNTIDTTTFSPKAALYPATSSPTWATSTVKMQEVDALAKLIRQNGKKRPNILIFGATAWSYWIKDAAVQQALSNYRGNFALVKPILNDEGASFQGEIAIGSYVYQMYTYDATYVTPAAPSTPVPYVPDNKVIVAVADARRDATFGTVQVLPGYENEPSFSYLPKVITPDAGGPTGIALRIGAYPSQDRQQVNLWVATRMLLVPTAIDCHGCLTVL